MPVRFAFLTDTHHYPDAPENFGAPKMLTRSQEVLDAIPPALNTQAFDFVVHGGDFLCGGGSFNLLENDRFALSIKPRRCISCIFLGVRATCVRSAAA